MNGNSVPAGSGQALEQGRSMGQGYGYGMPQPGIPPGMGPAAGLPPQQHGMAQVMQELANGGNLGGLTQLFDFRDTEFWKGALVGAAAVLLLTNDSVQRALFRGAAAGKPSATTKGDTP